MFRFLADVVSPLDGGFQTAIEKRGGVSKIRSLAAHRISGASLEIGVGSESGDTEWRYVLAFKSDHGRALITKEEVWHKDHLKPLIKRPVKDDVKDSERLTQTALEQVNSNREFRELADFLNTAKYLHLVLEFVRGSGWGLSFHNDPYGADFMEQVAGTPDKTRIARLTKINAALKFAVPQLDELELWKDNLGKPHLRGKYLHWRPQGGWQTEEDFSDGTIRLLGILWA